MRPRCWIRLALAVPMVTIVIAAATRTVAASQVNPARPDWTNAYKCAWHTFLRRSLLQRWGTADARVDMYLWIRTATIAASMTA